MIAVTVHRPGLAPVRLVAELRWSRVVWGPLHVRLVRRLHLDMRQ